MLIPFKLIPRAEPSFKMQIIVPFIVVILTLLAGLAIFMTLGVDPQTAFKAYFIDPLSSLYGVSEWLLKALPLCLIGLGLAVAYRAQVWNIGAEVFLTQKATCGVQVTLKDGNAVGQLIQYTVQ